ncbi:hypothetical protein [Govanella unica]|uniref:Uncharacterized protein n=1 Tax=Govanella unica TaxID=2975056 RepID=A0A9X3TX43_9PROT|nr:hypothetical protein [Govania unica]MDA5193610.1 hypothetical protein [Govania unica]
MEAMGNLSQDDNSNRMSMRNSLLVWVFGAVLGWAVAVVAVYSIIRDEGDRAVATNTSEPHTNQKKTIAQPKEADELNAIEPAAGPSKPAVHKH